MSPRIDLYDTTLRDGTQMEGISLSVTDKLKIAERLDELGVHYIEGGYPGSNPKDAEFFARAGELNLRNAKLAAFGSTRRPNAQADSDPNLRALVEARTPAVTIVGKGSDRQVHHVLGTTLEENLAMLADSVRFLKSKGLTVFFDAEHFYDGFVSNKDYSLQCARVAAEAGADCVVLCDTNGGMVSSQFRDITRAVVDIVECQVGVHAHNAADTAVANSLAGIEVGATHVQGAANGYGDMTGNANMFSIIANIKLKLGIDCVTDEQLQHLAEVSHFVSEIANMPPNPRQPYVGVAAFTHKAGLHAAGVAKEAWSFQHIDPALVGNDTRILVSELAGRHLIESKLKERDVGFELTDTEIRAVLEQVKHMESRGFVYEGAEASFELLVRRGRPDYQAFFELVDFMIVERRHHDPEELGRAMISEAMVKLRVGERVLITADEGNGPVNALDGAVRKALAETYPDIHSIHLVDYKVRIIDSASGTGASVRVLIESTDGVEIWTTVGSSTDIIEASWLALADSLEYWLIRHTAARN
ncbi:MAG TPA: citramalate synthase [Dehalococcoidia bacterium]|nr:citramalate synthase [Dehalococcoidia bacterium]